MQYYQVLKIYTGFIICKKVMKNDNQSYDEQFQKLKQSVLDVSQQKLIKNEPYSFHKKLQQKMKNNTLNGYDSNKQIDILQASQYIKLLSHQKKYLSQKRSQKINQLNQSLNLQQEDFRYMFLVSTQANYYKLQYPGYYERILEQIEKYPKNMFTAIQKDIPRTLLNQHPFQKCLDNILKAYAIRNPKLLYCQGMNYLVAYFLINNIPQEDTFWILTSLIQNILPDDFYKDLTTISIITQIFTDIFPYLFPQLAKEMKQIGMDSSLFVVSWYVCLFTKGFINSVSQYLMVKLILQSRKHSVGFILLKLSLGIIATILGRDQPFSFRRQFAAFRDKIEVSVFQISLLEIKLGVQYVQLNEQNYLKLQKYYRQKRENRHISAIEKDLKNKKFTLPKCTPQYPICLQRIQIQRKIGNVQDVLIMKTGYNILSQYIENYFDKQVKKQSPYTTYQNPKDCLMYREDHICLQQDQLNRTSIDLESKLFNRIQLTNDDSYVKQSQRQISILTSNQITIMQQNKRFSKMDSRFIELSGFFVIDQKFKFGNDEIIDDQEQEEDGEQIEKDQNKKQLRKQKSNQICSKTSLEEPFDLAKQLQKNNIEQEWLKNEDEYKNQSEIQKQNQQNISISSIDIDKKQNKSKGQNRIDSQKQVININKQSNSSQERSGFISKKKIRNYFGNIWEKVWRIKQQELKN